MHFFTASAACLTAACTMARQRCESTTFGAGAAEVALLSAAVEGEYDDEGTSGAGLPRYESITGARGVLIVTTALADRPKYCRSCSCCSVALMMSSRKREFCSSWSLHSLRIASTVSDSVERT